MNHPHHGQPRSANRRRLICGLVAAGVLGLGALLPSASGTEGQSGDGAESPMSPMVPADDGAGADGGPAQ